MQIRSVMTSYCLQLKMVKYLNKQYQSSVLETWHHNCASQTVRGISSYGYLMTSLKMASELNKQESIFTPSLRPWRCSPLNLSHETKCDGKVITEEHVERNEDGFFCFRAAKSSLKVQSTVVFGIPLKWISAALTKETKWHPQDTREKRSAHACLPCFRREFAIENYTR